MNISGLKDEKKQHERHATVPIYSLSGEQYRGKDGTLTEFFVIGEYADAYRQAVREINREHAERAGATALQTDDENDKEAELFAAKRIAAGVVGWKGVDDVDGAAVPFNKRNALQILLDAPWIQKRVYAAIVGHSSFFPKQSTG